MLRLYVLSSWRIKDHYYFLSFCRGYFEKRNGRGDVACKDNTDCLNYLKESPYMPCYQISSNSGGPWRKSSCYRGRRYGCKIKSNIMGDSWMCFHETLSKPYLWAYDEPDRYCKGNSNSNRNSMCKRSGSRHIREIFKEKWGPAIE